MTVSLKHKKVAVGPNAGNGEVHLEEWNDEHNLLMSSNRLLGRTTAGDGAAEEISVGSNMTLAAGVLSVTDAKPIKLSAVAQYYVSTTGSNSNDGSSGSPWATLQYAWNWIASNVNINGYAAIINVAAGSYAGISALSYAAVPNGTISIVGAGYDQTTVTRSSTNNACFDMNLQLQNISVGINNLKIDPTISPDTTIAFGVYANRSGRVTIGEHTNTSLGTTSGTVEVACLPGTVAVLASNHAYAAARGTVRVSGSSIYRFLSAQIGATVEGVISSLTIVSSPITVTSAAAWLVAISGGRTFWTATTVSGTFTGRSMITSAGGCISLNSAIPSSSAPQTQKLDPASFVSDRVNWGMYTSDLGTITSGTVTLEPYVRLIKYTNNGAHILNVDAGSSGGESSGNWNTKLFITNGASAGSIDTTAFTKVTGSFSTTSGNKFLCDVWRIEGNKVLTITPLQ